ncbi:hypothetical protein X566_01380 [Afipia sp. P52-10]|nr:hypothetical protein X566_01380 [Afipia sp. P52-10]
MPAAKAKAMRLGDDGVARNVVAQRIGNLARR